MLTISANGIKTSPVIRGVWVLENILAATQAGDYRFRDLLEHLVLSPAFRSK